MKDLSIQKNKYKIIETQNNELNIVIEKNKIHTQYIENSYNDKLRFIHNQFEMLLGKIAN